MAGTNVRPDSMTLERAWALLEDSERKELWRFIGLAVQSLQVPKGAPRANFNEYDALCAGVQELDRNQRTKASVTGLPRSPRRLSSGELQKAVARHKEKLFAAPYVRSFFGRMYSRWVQFERTDLLLAVLDAFECAHDEIGKLTGVMPSIQPAQAADVLVRMAEHRSAHQLRIVCAGLMLNSESWDACLGDAIEALGSIPERPASSPSAPEDAVTRPPQEERIQDEVGGVQGEAPSTVRTERTGEWSPVQTLPALTEKLAALRSSLLHAAREAEEQLVPDSAEVVPQWLALEATLQDAIDSTGLKTRSLSDLGNLVITRETKDRLKKISEEALCVSDANSARDLAPIRDRATELASKLEQSEVDELESLAAPLEALLALLRPTDALTDEETSDLYAVVSQGFGPTIAIAALRGNLLIRQGHAGGAAISSAEFEADVARPSLDSTNVSSANAGAREGPEDGGVADTETSILPDRTAPDAAPVGEPVPPESAKAVAPTSTPDEIEERDATPKPLSEFLRSKWIDEAGRIRSAPWVDAEFEFRLRRGVEEAWANGNFDLAVLFSAAGKALGFQTKLSPEDISSAERLFAEPTDLARVRDSARLRRIRSTQKDLTTNELAVCLEALAPTFPVTLSNADVGALLDATGFTHGPLRSVVEFLLNGWAALVDPIELIRVQALDTAADPETLSRKLSEAQANLRYVSGTQWNAGGGRIVHTHCRRAWSDFVRNRVAALRDLMAPPADAKKVEPWTVLDARRRVAQLGQAFARIMTEQNVLHQDRAAAVSAADQIVAAMEQVVSAKQQLEELQKRKKPGGIHAVIPTQAVAQVLMDLPSDPQDRICTLLVRSVLTGERAANPFALPVGYLLAVPVLVRLLVPQALRRPDLLDGLLVADFLNVQEDPPDPGRLIAAGALLLQSPRPSHVTVQTVEELLLAIRDVAVDRQRWDILAGLSATDILAPHERTQLHRRALELGEQAYEMARRLVRAWSACEAMRAPATEQLKARVDEALAACSGAPERPLAEIFLLLAWLRIVVASAEAQESAFAQVRLSQCKEKMPDRAAEMAALVEARNYPLAMSILDMVPPSEELLDETPRRTMWRSDGVKRFAQPRSALLKELKGVNQAQNALVSEWAQAESDDPSYRDSLRRALYDVVSGESHLPNEKSRRSGLVRLSDLREHLTRRTVIKCPALREYFKTARLNPTFLPQLADFDQIVLTSGSWGQVGGSTDAYIRLAAQVDAGVRTLTVFLEPGLPLERRDEIVVDLRRRKVAAVILDDIDICRLCSIGVERGQHNFVPFLEVVLEQLDLEMVSPFSSSDGQHIKLETFVGRLEDADQVALQWKYSRLFSGRKLGKSAFLRHVASKYDGIKVGDKTLRVIFISIAGGDSEAWVVNSIIEEMKRRLAFLEDLSPSHRVDAPARLMEYIARFAAERPSENVLLILDEADAFVEEQLRQYDSNGARKREGTLSFRMMKQMPASSNPDEMPRFRVLFSGYRVTNTRGGVWANAGDVLILRPLSEADSVLFLQGMLGRIGVDIGESARFAARRCGFQPAVLIRFGESLLKRIRRGTRLGARETYRVTDDDVIAAMNDQLVLDEIRTVVNNNFQGDRIAATIFGATLLALKDLEPGMALNDGPGQVLAKLSEIDTDLEWLTAGGAPPLAQIERQLQEFIDRELLASDSPRFGERQYRLKFPHFLPVLIAQVDVALEVRQHIQFLRSGSAGQRIVESVLPESSLENLRYWFRQSHTDLCSVAVAAGHWTAGLQDGKAGIPDRLGVGPLGVCSARGGIGLAERVVSGTRVFQDVGAGEWKALSQVRATRPLVTLGGVDLLRDALRHVLEGAEPQVDIVPFSPLSERAIAWWFENARALDFKSPNAIARIAAETDGIPVLVGAFDSVLPSSVEHIGGAAFEATVRDFRSALPAIAASLIDGSPDVRLTAREAQLLMMVCQVAANGLEEFDLELDLAESWEACKDANNSLVVPLADSTDRLSFQVLLASGLLRTSPMSGLKSSALGRVLVPKDGALMRLVSAFGDRVAG